MKLITTTCLGALCLVTACKGDTKKEGAPQPSAGSAPAPHAAPVEGGSAAAPAAAGTPKIELAAGETFEKPSEDARVEATWGSGKDATTLVAVVRGDKLVLRAFGAGAPADVESLSAWGTSNNLTARKDGILFESTDIVGREPEVGALAAYELRLITFDGGAPKVAQTWSCDESKTKRSCTPPAWAEAK